MKEAKDFYNESYKSLKEIEEDTRRWKEPHVHGLVDSRLWEWQYHQNQLTDSSNTHQNSNIIFCKNRKINTKIHMEV
jgi:hypothetical protein